MEIQIAIGIGIEKAGDIIQNQRSAGRYQPQRLKVASCSSPFVIPLEKGIHKAFG